MCLMMKKNKNILIILVIGIVLIVSIFFSLNKKEYHELPKVKIKDDINKSGLAIMVEKDYQAGEYQQSNSTIFPTDGYTLNRIKSGCVDKNGKDVDALTYNEDNKTINIKTKQSVYCYLYYDNLFKGLGTEEEPYQINYIEDLVRLSNSVNKDLNVYKDKNFKLMRDLDFNENASYMKYNDTGFGDINGVNNIEGIKEELTNKEGIGFMPIGFTQYFEGNFNGNNKRIDNLYVHNKNDINKYYGFIAYLNNGSIKNITMSGEVLSDVEAPLGGIVNRIANSTMDNCVNEINITSNGKQYANGGLISWSSANATITNSVNKGNVSNGGYTGGIIGGSQGGTLTLDNCHNEGVITNELGNSTGGLVGRDNGDNAKTIIRNSYNAGDVTNSLYVEGGLIGRVYGTVEIYNSRNTGKISNTLGTYIGGLIGLGDNTSKIIINNSYNDNKVSCNSVEEKDIILGGLIGTTDGQLNITSSYNSGTIENERTDYAEGSFEGKNIVEGGLIGILTNKAESYINNSYNTGNISNNLHAGGIIGDIIIAVTGKDYIINSYNVGDITGSRSAGGFFTHYSQGALSTKYVGLYYLNNVYNIGIVSGNGNIKQSIGYFNYETDRIIRNAYYLDSTASTGTNLANDSELTIKMNETDMKNKTFVDTLNKNALELNNVGLEAIDENLKEYELEKWGLKYKVYPVLTKKIEDLSGRGNHGLSYAVKEDVEGITTSIDSTHLGYIDAGLSNYNFGNNFAIALKFKINKMPYSSNALIGNWESGGLGILIKNNNGVYNLIGGVYTDKRYDFEKPYDFKLNEWYTMVLTYDGTLASDNLKIYINGVLHDTVNVTGIVKIPTYNVPILIGAEPTSTYNTDGLAYNNAYATYKEALIFDRALTEEQDHISTNYKDDINVTNQEELLVWYKF